VSLFESVLTNYPSIREQIVK